jgi:hypothetical protein
MEAPVHTQKTERRRSVKCNSIHSRPNGKGGPEPKAQSQGGRGSFPPDEVIKRLGKKGKVTTKRKAEEVDSTGKLSTILKYYDD